MGLFKLCMWCLGISLGAYFSEFFLPYLVPLLVVGSLLATYLVYIWARE